MSDASPDQADLVTLRGGDLRWRGVSPRLRTARLISLVLTLLPGLLATGIVGALVTRWVWLGTAAVLLGGLWSAWLIHRQVSAISWIELPEELVIRKGRIYRTLVSLPYGRLQYVDMTAGPVARWLGIASCEFHTASPQSGGSLPGLPVLEAEELRARLAARGETQRAGL